MYYTVFKSYPFILFFLFKTLVDGNDTTEVEFPEVPLQGVSMMDNGTLHVEEHPFYEGKYVVVS